MINNEQHLYQADNRMKRIWALRKLYFNFLVKEAPRFGLINTFRTQFPFAFKDSITPPSLSVEFTNHCNLSCTYCTSPLKLRPVGLMDHHIFNKVVEGIVDCKVKSVCMIGNGEAIIHPNYVEYMNALRKVTPVLSLTTNAKFDKENLIYDTIDAELNHINISVDSDNKETYESLRLRGNFDKLLKDLQSLKKYKDSKKSKTLINLRVMICPAEFHRQKEIMAFWAPYADVISKQYVIDINDTHNGEYFSTDAVDGRYPKCSLPFKILGIQWNGNIPLCTYSWKQTGIPTGLTLGNIGTTSLREIWNSKIMQQYRDAHRSRDTSKMPICNNCMGT